MIGNLTFDKASMNMSYFLYSILLIEENGGEITRSDFVEKMARLVGVPAINGGKENRTAYNKNKMPRYFGFIDIVTYETGMSLKLTNRGKAIVPLIVSKGDDEPSESRFIIDPNKRQDFIELIMGSIIFDSFGKNNCGAEQSNTDVEPPKIVFRTIFDLGKATTEEICYIIYSMNNKVHASYDEALQKIKENRRFGKYDYSRELEEWGALNFARDFKLVNIFTDPSINLLFCEKDDEIGKNFYFLTADIKARYGKEIAQLSAVYAPLHMIVYSEGNAHETNTWLYSNVLGRVSSERFVFEYDCELESKIEIIGDTPAQSQLVKAILTAFQNPKNNVYVIINNIGSATIEELLKQYGSAIPRIDSFWSDNHGFSTLRVSDKATHDYLRDNSPFAKQILTGSDDVAFPSNLHILGTVKMSKKADQTLVTDYGFKTCLVKSDEADSQAQGTPYTFDTAKGGAQNRVVYGTPGCGKSFYVQNTYLAKCGVPNDMTHRIRTTFYMDYTNTDFVGQILPKVKPNGEVTYDFNPGPFALALKAAIENPEESVALIIEELNRGNAASIFGDIFQLLDRDANGKSQYSITNVNLQDYLNKCFEGVYTFSSISIPANLYIVATMNTSDQNVFTLDTAFKRRWQFEKLRNEFTLAHEYKDYFVPGMTGVTWETLVTAINKYIVDRPDDLASEDKQLGVYFIEKGTLCATAEECSDETKINRFAFKLFEYLWDDVAKYAHSDWFAAEIKTLDDLIDGYKRLGAKVFADGVLDLS